MVPFEQRIIAIVFSLAFLILTVQLIRKHKLRAAYALGWLISAVVILILSIFGGIVDIVAGWFSISYTPTLILVVGLLVALVILLVQSVVLSTQANRLRDLAQHSALVEWRLRQMEESNLPIQTPAVSQPKNGLGYPTNGKAKPEPVLMQDGSSPEA